MVEETTISLVHRLVYSAFALGIAAEENLHTIVFYKKEIEKLKVQLKKRGMKPSRIINEWKASGQITFRYLEDNWPKESKSEDHGTKRDEQGVRCGQGKKKRRLRL